MSVLSDGFLDWFRLRKTDESTLHHSQTTTGGDLDQEPVIVWRANNQMEAQVVKGRLESEGIPAIIRGEAVGAIYGLTSGSLAETSVLVPAALAAQAEAILYAEVEEIASDQSFDDLSGTE
jgi:hypothetical protein